MLQFLVWLLIPVLSVFGQSLCSGDPQPRSPCAGWESLSQMSSLMPERIWEQEFQIRVDKVAFQKALLSWMTQVRRESLHQPLCVLGSSYCYFLKATLSGETCRLLDIYQEFQWSPFWKYPPRLEELRSLDKQIEKENL